MTPTEKAEKAVRAQAGTVRMWFNGLELFDSLNLERECAVGPWDDEPSKMQWVDEETKLPCLIVRNHAGALCGYAGVPPAHPMHGKGYDDVSVDIHGGLTFAAGCGHGEDESRGICHVPEPGTTDDVWWFGFDCSHLGDLAPFRLMWDKRYASLDGGAIAKEMSAGMTRMPVSSTTAMCTETCSSWESRFTSLRSS